MYEKFQQIIEVGADGNWSVDVPNNFDAGLHTVVVESIATKLKDVGFFAVQAAQVLTEKLEAPSVLSFGIALLLSMVIFLASYSVKLDRRIRYCENKSESLKLEHDKKHVHKAIYISSACVIIALLVVFNINRQYQVNFIPEKLNNASNNIQEILIPTVSGAVVSPSTNQPLSGVDLQGGEVVVRTSDSGRYVFNNLDISQPLKITHPSLRRVITYKIDENTSQIFFDAKIFNNIVDLLEGEYSDFKSEQELPILDVKSGNGSIKIKTGYREEVFEFKVSEGEWQLVN